ncbi:MAG: ABC transporter ATP-binding protein [Lachnospiraceae bacterium]|nr:ABC transporter ATP-binding protein [Candidatus Colinaster scatohippi]
MGDLKKINYIFDRKQKIKILLIAFMIMIGAIFELLGITAILPFIEVTVDPRAVEKSEWMSRLYNQLGVGSTNAFLAILAIALVIVYVVKNVYLAVMNYAIYRFTYNNQRILAHRMLKLYMKQPYTFFLKYNSAELMRNVSDDTSALFDTVLSVMQVSVEIIVCSMLFVYLMITDKTITIAVGIVIVIALGIIVRALKKDLNARGEHIRQCRGNMGKWLLQSFGGIKETMIMERQGYFEDRYNEIYTDFSHNHCTYQTFAYLPKPIMETFCIGGILGVIALKLLRGVDSTYFITTISVFSVAAFRLLPAFNRITGYISRIMFNHSAVSAVYNDIKEVEEIARQTELKLRNREMKTLPFEKGVVVDNISFHYPEVDSDVLSDATIEIPKNKSVAFIGPSGAGKTTMADIILGVLVPQKGCIRVDGQDITDYMPEWHNKLGYIPQSIYLMDDTIKHNIAYGLTDDEIDDDRIEQVLVEAQLKDFVDTLESGVDSYIGEGGVRISGGQRQRIGIARALYNNPDVLVLDEATSALDGDTETAVMEAINSLAGKKTLIIIAHRLTTIRNCDFIYEISDHKAVLRDRDSIDA